MIESQQNSVFLKLNFLISNSNMVPYSSFQIRDMEVELDEEKRRHSETIKILRKKERNLKEIVIQCEEDHKNVSLLQEQLDKVNQKVNLYKRQLQEQVRNYPEANLYFSLIICTKTDFHWCQFPTHTFISLKMSPTTLIASKSLI